MVMIFHNYYSAFFGYLCQHKQNKIRTKCLKSTIDLGAVSLTNLSILKEGFTPIFSPTLSYGKSVSP